jgi:hypothetical protein
MHSCCTSTARSSRSLVTAHSWRSSARVRAAATASSCPHASSGTCALLLPGCCCGRWCACWACSMAACVTAGCVSALAASLVRRVHARHTGVTRQAHPWLTGTTMGGICITLRCQAVVRQLIVLLYHNCSPTTPSRRAAHTVKSSDWRSHNCLKPTYTGLKPGGDTLPPFTPAPRAAGDWPPPSASTSLVIKLPPRTRPAPRT